MFAAVIMTLYLVEHALLLLLESASSENREFRHIRNLQRGTTSNKVIWALINRFEETQKLGIKSGRSCKLVIPVSVDGVRTDLATQSQTSEFAWLLD